MPNGEANTAIRDLRTLFDAGAIGRLSDGQLLDRFVARREDVVFEALVERHGPMVWGVCRRVLCDHHDAEDAFQAAFLVLARRADSVRPRERVGPWLHGVACRTAMKQRAARARRRARETPVPDVPEPVGTPGDPHDDRAGRLDRELCRLPEKYRVPILLCDLEGKSHREAAEQLGWPIGTVSGRLSRARQMLARRVSGRDGAPGDASLAALLARDLGAPVLPRSLVPSTVEAARLFVGGRAAAIPVGVATLARGVLKTLLIGKLTKLAAIVLAITLVGAGAALIGARAEGKAPPEDAFRVTVEEVLKDSDAIVARIDIETPAGAWVQVEGDKEGRGGPGSRAQGEAGGPARTRIVLFADHAVWPHGKANLLKFVMSVKSGGGATYSNTGPMPEGKRLADVVGVAIKSGEFRYGEPTPLVTFQDLEGHVTYRLVVKKPGEEPH